MRIWSASPAPIFFLAKDDDELARRIRHTPREITAGALTDALRRRVAASFELDNRESTKTIEAIERLIRQGASVTPAHIESAPTAQVRAILEAGALRQAVDHPAAATAKIRRGSLGIHAGRRQA